MKRQRTQFCTGCGHIILDGERFCGSCGASVRWGADDSVELRVTGAADEVESVTRRLVAELSPSLLAAESAADPSPDAEDRWSKSRKVWAFAIGLTTIVGGVATVLALFIH